MGNEKIEAMIRHLERFDTGGRTGVQGELVTDCETCGIYDEPCSGCRIRSGEEVRAMMAALKWGLNRGLDGNAVPARNDTASYKVLPNGQYLLPNGRKYNPNPSRDCPYCGVQPYHYMGCTYQNRAQTGTTAVAEQSEPDPSDGMGPEIDDEGGMSEAEVNRED